ncbi:Aspartate/ornithine carbamoyltransferase [Lasiosphaeria miniovina]|uniref:Ornithine carbamoyltransferase, mitochondrial n=1 Tax=Lasiosphaeria miniovina TaxID=1954250 RepID=A0AA40DK77_9PEZI|nr:Aspartate/ornithine carbamoyltransferase [Lasiosphaeria miniovina]KAK0706699.1 Aspartate/ornithine carbamoyltransferase [Lasiosphaeria miniovina]
MNRAVSRTAKSAVGHLQARCASNSSSSSSSSAGPRHLMSISDLSPAEFSRLVLNASSHKAAIRAARDAGQPPQSLYGKLTGQTVAMMFSKRSTRTRVSTEAAVTVMGGHPMFLGKDDIQLGVNESLLDTSKVISSMTSCMVARVGPHSDVAGLAEHSAVPVINALSDDFHPLQTIADFQTIHEAFRQRQPPSDTTSLGLGGLKVAWVGDSNNVLFDLATACIKTGVDIAVASPPGYGIPAAMKQVILSAGAGVSSPGRLSETTVPEEAVRGADILVTDTWVSMGQEAEAQARVRAFAGYQITRALAERGGAKPGWKFMHCLPRHQEEVDDDVFYGPQSLVFDEAENRVYAAVAALEAFVVNKGKVV